MKKLDIQQFIEQHSDWEKLLQEKPYCLVISRAKWNDMNLIMFKYNQIESDFNQRIVRQCRGLILNEDTLEVVSYPFEKFGNVSEGSWVEKIDWSQKPYVLDKIDGSLIKVVKLNGELLISTNGTILAAEAPIAEQIGCKAKCFYHLVVEAIWNNRNFKPSHLHFITSKFGEWHDHPDRKTAMRMFASSLEEGYTYMFELTSPWNRVVVDHHETKLWFIGCRNNKTYQELFIKDHPLANVFETPGIHDFSSFETCIETAKSLPWNEEGYVVTSSDFKRNKVKSLAYLSCHHLKNNGVMSYSRAIELIRLNEADEVLSYFPEFKDAILKVKEKYFAFVSELDEAQFKLDSWIKANGFADQKWWIQSGGQKRKDLAIWVMSNIKKFSGFAFGYVDDKIQDANAYLKSLTSDKIAIALGYKD